MVCCPLRKKRMAFGAFGAVGDWYRIFLDELIGTL